MKTNNPVPWWKSPHWLMMLVCIVILPFALLEAINGNWLSALFILLCPLMHLFMMNSMGHSCDEAASPTDQPDGAVIEADKRTVEKEF